MTVHHRKPSSKPKCGGKKHGVDERCTQAAGWGTDHPGSGRCKLHGGATPIQHGRYSDIEREGLKEAQERFAADPAPLDLLPELALMRAITEDLVNRWHEIFGPEGALLAWHESYLSGRNDAPKPRQLPDFSTIGGLIDKVGKMAERIHKQKQSALISFATVNRVMEQLGVEVVRAVESETTDADTRARILAAVEQRWGTIKLNAVSVSTAPTAVSE